MTDVAVVCSHRERVHKIKNGGSLAPEGWPLNIQDASRIAVVAKKDSTACLFCCVVPTPRLFPSIPLAWKTITAQTPQPAGTIGKSPHNLVKVELLKITRFCCDSKSNDKKYTFYNQILIFLLSCFQACDIKLTLRLGKDSYFFHDSWRRRWD